MPAFSVDESLVIDAPLAQVRESLLDFRQWPAWSPWICAEPDCKIEYAADGKSYHWEGAIIGSGSMKILREQDSRIDYDLQFLKPFKSKAKVNFELLQEGADRTKVHWRMESSMPFFLFFMVKKTQALISSDYRRGLQRLKDFIERGEVQAKLEFPGASEGLDTQFLGLRKLSKISEIAAVSEGQFERLAAELERLGLEPSGPPMTISHSFDPVQDRLAYTLAIPVAKPVQGHGEAFVSERIKLERCYKIVLRGPYRHLASAWACGMMHAQAKVFRSDTAADKVERYLNDPQRVPEQELCTELLFPMRS